MKYCEWLKMSRETVWLPVKIVGDNISFGSHTGIGGTGGSRPKPSPTTFYPPIDKGGNDD